MPGKTVVSAGKGLGCAKWPVCAGTVLGLQLRVTHERLL